MAPRTSLTLLWPPLFLLLLSGHCATVTSFSFFYNFSNPKTFSHSDDLHFEGHAYMGDGSIILAKNRDVRDVSSKVGRVSSNHPVNLWSNNNTSEVVSGFSTSFSFVIICGSNSSNDTGGMLSFFLTPFSPQMPLKSEAGHLLSVFNSAIEAGGSKWGVAAVMDSSSHGDFNWDTNLSSEKYKVAVHNLANGVPKILQLEYSDVRKDLIIALQDFTNCTTKTMSIKMSVDLRQHLPQEVAMGFFASTAGSGASVHQLLWWSFCTHTATVQGNLPTPILARYVLESPDNSSASSGEGHHDSRGKSNRKVVIGSIVGAALFAVTSLVVACLCRINKARSRWGDIVVPGALGPGLDLEGRGYSYEEVLNATDNFSEERLLEGGGSYSFYRGDNFENSGMTVAVKKLEIKEEEFWTYGYPARIRALTKCRHRNMVRLMGWCRQGETLCLVYEFVENGNLAEHVYSPGRLPWKLRYKIVLGMASALEYLHDNNVHHGNIKLSNVMLDESFDARLSDFDFERYPKLPVTDLEASMKYDDVKRFGMVLLLIACGQRLISSWHDRDADTFVRGYVWDMFKKGTILEAADERLNGDFDNGEMELVLLVGLMCTCYTTHPPTIREAARRLRSDPPASFLLPWMVPDPITDVGEASGSADHTLPKPWYP